MCDLLICEIFHVDEILVGQVPGSRHLWQDLFVDRRVVLLDHFQMERVPLHLDDRDNVSSARILVLGIASRHVLWLIGHVSFLLMFCLLIMITALLDNSIAILCYLDMYDRQIKEIPLPRTKLSKFYITPIRIFK